MVKTSSYSLKKVLIKSVAAMKSDINISPFISEANLMTGSLRIRKNCNNFCANLYKRYQGQLLSGKAAGKWARTFR